MGLMAFGTVLLGMLLTATNQTTTSSSKNNIWMTPLGLFRSLKLIEGAAGGQTKQQLASLLPNVTLFPSDDFNDASSVWTRVRLSSRFSTTSNLSGVPVRPLASAPQVNSWVRRHTSGLIDAVVTSKQVRNSALLVVNAVHFAKRWLGFRFSPLPPRTWNNELGLKIAYMYVKTDLPFIYSPDKYEAVRLSIEGAQNWAATIVLPARGQKIASLLGSLESIITSLADTAAHRTYLQLELPEFQMDWSSSLKPALESSGVRDVFLPHVANFSGLCANPAECQSLFVDDVLQKSKLKLTRNGIEAAAATAALFKSYAFISHSHRVRLVNVDRPFLLVLHRGNDPLFLGVVSKPQPVPAAQRTGVVVSKPFAAADFVSVKPRLDPVRVSPAKVLVPKINDGYDEESTAELLDEDDPIFEERELEGGWMDKELGNPLSKGQ